MSMYYRSLTLGCLNANIARKADGLIRFSSRIKNLSSGWKYYSQIAVLDNMHGNVDNFDKGESTNYIDTSLQKNGFLIIPSPPPPSPSLPTPPPPSLLPPTCANSPLEQNEPRPLHPSLSECCSQPL